MTAKETLVKEAVEIPAVDVEAVLDPVECDGVYRDSRQCGALTLQQGSTGLLLSPPLPRPKKS
ncbi:hypothetical protein ACIF8T_27375 [Streptomyces sp. NPDC085946]|uniref:hypothetical protein n=1 Tax=Streptomyces sp. NPDC085946 TaxID=3365744 RepID=UPI0037D7E674